MHRDAIMTDLDKTASVTSELSGNDELEAAIVALIDNSTQRLMLAAPEFTLPLFLRPSFNNMLRHLTTGRRDNLVDIQTNNEPRFLRANSALASLARRHASHVRVRVLPARPQLVHELIVIGDDAHVVHQPDMAIEAGLFIQNNIIETARYLERIKPWWDLGEHPAELFTAGL